MKQIDFSGNDTKKNVAGAVIPLLVADILALLYSVVDRIYIGRAPDAGELFLVLHLTQLLGDAVHRHQLHALKRAGKGFGDLGRNAGLADIAHDAAEPVAVLGIFDGPDGGAQQPDAEFRQGAVPLSYPG